jgi:PAS domain S-box-containing protein
MQKLKRYLTLKTSYFIIFISLSAWAFFAFFTMNELIVIQKQYAKIINISGKQRMLSQKTAFMVKRVFETNDLKHLKHLEELIALMKKDHNFLISNLTSEYMSNIYFNKPNNLNNEVLNYFKLLDEFVQNEERDIINHIEAFAFNLLPKLDFAVNEFEKESNKNTSELQQREYFILIGTLLTLIIELIFIMLPTLKLRKESEKKLKHYNKELKNEVERKTQEILKEYERRKFYLDNIHSLLIALDTNGNIKMINKYACDILGYNYKDLVGKNWFKIGVVPESELNKLKLIFKNIIAGRVDIQDKSIEYKLLDKNHEEKLFTWANATLEDHGQTTGILLSGIDISDQRKQERVLAEQQKLASMGEMIGNIAHQWRQPLSVITTISSGVKLQKEYGILEDEKLYESLDKITESSEYLSKTIDTFRNFLKENKESKKGILQEGLLQAIDIVRPSLDNNHINLIHNIDEIEDIEIKLVMGELVEVIINILNNAKDAHIGKDIENPWIKIKLHKGRKYIQITIEDNAGGIPNEIISRIFEPYFTTKHESQGTGLGLHMSHKIIAESLDGQLSVKNTKYGAKFFIDIPLKN